jgi:hypothetical protein
VWNAILLPSSDIDAVDVTMEPLESGASSLK